MIKYNELKKEYIDLLYEIIFKFKSFKMQLFLTLLIIWGYYDTFVIKSKNATIPWYIFSIIIYLGFTYRNIKKKDKNGKK